MITRIPALFGSDAQQAARVRAVADRMGFTLDSRSGDGSQTRIGDRTLPEDAAPWSVEAALLRAFSPRHVLFLCVANSARSQLAEGIARDRAPGWVRISSAGSIPTAVRPEAIAVSGEIGIDITGHASSGIDSVDRSVDAVITLCAEEVCPAWLGSAVRLHWGLSDPAGVEGAQEARLEAFRTVRDDLVQRLDFLLGGLPPEPPTLGA